MITDTIDVGIDLGTSNSVVAVAHGGKVDVVRNAVDDQITSSVVRFLKNGAVQVGRKSYEHHRLVGDGSTFARFKRGMGRQSDLGVSGSGHPVTPETLSAEVLKSLRSDAERFLGRPVDAAVVTVPAMFELVQCEATQRAAALAGISQTVLLQEPIAAGLAYGYDRELGDSYLLVYDYGSGTFDVTLLRVADGHLSVVDLDGDNFLGGSDWDRRISGLLSQRLTERGFDLWSPDDPAGAQFKARLDLFAEQEKIRLTQLASTEAYFDGELTDRRGTPIETSIPLSRAEYEHLIEADIERSIHIATRLLEKQSILKAAVAKVILVGGPTRTPLLRNMVTARMGIPIESSIDPMTVVAEGAATFAASQRRETSASTHRSAGAAGEQEITLEYRPTVDDEITHVGGRINGKGAEGWSVEVVRGDGGWASGRVPVQNGTFFTPLTLVRRQANTFRLTCFDATGRPIACRPDQFTVTHGLVVDAPPLARPLLVEVQDAEGEPQRHVMVPKGAALPVTKRETFRATLSVAPGSTDDALDINVYEGEFERIRLNRHVGTLRIDGTRISRPLPKGTEIELTVRVNENRAVTVRAYIPLLDLTLEEVLENKSLPREESGEIWQALALDEQRSRDLLDLAPADAARILALLPDFKRELSDAGNDPDHVARAARRAREISNEIDLVAKRHRWPLKVQEVNSSLEWVSWAADRYGDDVHLQRLRALRSEVQQAIGTGQISAANRIDRELWQLAHDVAWNSAAFWANHLQYLLQEVDNGQMRLPSHLVAQGRHSLQTQDWDLARDTCLTIWKTEGGASASPFSVGLQRV